jgi:hypothetical protein
MKDAHDEDGFLPTEENHVAADLDSPVGRDGGGAAKTRLTDPPAANSP